MDPQDVSFQHPDTQEWAHDRRDPLREALCTYLEPAWESFPPENANPLRMLEVGFGRGLNTAMAFSKLAASKYSGKIQAWGCEPNPDFLLPWPSPPEALAEWMPWWGTSNPPEFQEYQLSQLPAKVSIQRKTAVEMLKSLPGSHIHWIFLDLFSPARHPEDWEPELYAGLARIAAPNAVLTSYCCARQVRDELQFAGWQCEVIRRPRYRDTLRARFLASEEENA